MTFREKLQMENPEYVGEEWSGGCRNCPVSYGYEKKRNCEFWESDEKCEKCWNREMPDTETLTEKEKMIDAMSENAYNKGLNDAWELAKKLNKPMKPEKVLEMLAFFNVSGYSEILETYTPQKALAKLKAYEEAQSKIEVGDVVTYSGEKCLVLDTKGDKVVVLTGDCCVVEWHKCDVEKTGKHIDIQSILESIGE